MPNESSDAIKNFSILPYSESGSGPVTILFLHFFGGSRRQWSEVIDNLGDGYRCIAADLPGFGDARDFFGFSVDEMAAHVCRLVDNLGLKSLWLVGHSMSGKVSLAVAKRMPSDVRGLVLVAPSPPCPEPIPDKARKQMLALARDREDGEEYIDGNSAKRLPEATRERSVEDFVRASPKAWSAWLEQGSREDWAARIGIVSFPTMVIAAELDKTLGPSVQEQLTLPHLSNGTLKVVQDSAHLIPMEHPTQLADIIRGFVSCR